MGPKGAHTPPVASIRPQPRTAVFSTETLGASLRKKALLGNLQKALAGDYYN